MILEKQIENNLLSAFTAMPELSSCQVVGSRDIAATGMLNQQDKSPTVVAVAAGFRQNQAFSLSPIDVAFTVTVATRLEEDPTAESHEKVVEAIADKLSYWHKYGVQMEAALSTQKFAAGELRMDGGSGRTADQSIKAYTDTIQFTLRGSERF